MSKINNTTAYPIVPPAIGDLVILSDVSDSKSTKNFQIGALNDLFIDTFVNPDATDFHIPVFNQGGVRITNSIMSQDSSPSNGVDGTKITIAGNLEINGTAEIDSLTSGFLPYVNPAGILSDSIIYQDAEGHVGVGVVGTPPNPEHKFEVYDLRGENNALDYSMIVSADVTTSGAGAGGIKNQLSLDGGVTYPYAISLVTGTTSSEVMATGKLAFFTNSDLNTTSATGFSGFATHDGTNPHWQLGGAVGDASPAETLKVVGNTTITGDAQIDTLANNYIPVNNTQGILRDSGFYQVNAPVTADKAIGLNTTNLDSFYGEYPDLRVASRQTNDPGVLDLFRPDGDVQGGDRVGILQYSLDDDAQYAVAQVEVKTIGNSGTGNTGGGKLCIKTSTNFPGAQPTERLCIDNTGADFSVPINVTDTNQSSFAGQVTIPTTPVAATDAASKAYVDSQSGGGGIAQTTGNYTPQIIANTPSEWVISSYSIQQGKWVRTGNLIHCDFYISISASNISGNTGGTSSLSIQGWPYNYEGNINDDYQDGNLVSANGFDVKMQSFDISVGSGLGNAKLSLNKQNTAVTNYYIETPMQTGDLNNGNSINIRGSFSYTTSNTTLNPGATIDP
jgi:hypothetical protein